MRSGQIKTLNLLNLLMLRCMYKNVLIRLIINFDVILLFNEWKN